MPEIRITRTYAASPERVFAAWTEPDAIAAWYGPGHMRVPPERVHVDLRAGGRWELTMVHPEREDEFTIGYDILEVRAPELLVMRSDPLPHLSEPTIVRLELVAEGDGTRLELTDGPMPEIGGAAAAYERALDKLADALGQRRRALGCSAGLM